MASFVVMQPPGKDKNGDPALPIFVRDGFSWAALVFGPLWLAWHRAWLAAAIALAVMVMLNAAGLHFGIERGASLLSTLVSLYVGLEGSAIRLAALRRRGFADAGVVQADHRDDAELRFAVGIADAEIVRPRPLPPAHLALRKPPQPDPTLGAVIFPERR